MTQHCLTKCLGSAAQSAYQVSPADDVGQAAGGARALERLHNWDNKSNSEKACGFGNINDGIMPILAATDMANSLHPS